MNLFYDEIGNPLKHASAGVVEAKETYDGYMYNKDGRLFMYLSGTHGPDELAHSLSTWGAAGFIPLSGTPLTKDNADQYLVNDGALATRQPLPAVLDGNTLKGVPDGGKVTIEGIEYPTDGTDITLHFGKPGTYVVKCEGFPYTPVEVEVVYGN